jgi:hypothetical protein
MAALGPQSKALAVCLQKRVAIRAARGGEVFPYAVAGILDDIADCFRHVSDTETAHTDQFAARTFELANFQTNGKTQIGDDGVVDVLGARADLRKGTLLPKGRKLLETLYQMALLRALMRGASEGSRSVKGSAATGVVSAPTAGIESVAGSFEWAGPTFDWYLRLHRQGLHAAVAFLKKQRYAEAHLSSSSAVARMLVDDVRVALDRALDGRWRPTRFFPADGVEAIRITCARAPCAPLPRGEAQSQAALVQGFVEPAVTPAGQQVLGLVGDAMAPWAAATSTCGGGRSRGARSAPPGWATAPPRSCSTCLTRRSARACATGSLTASRSRGGRWRTATSTPCGL